MTTETPPEAQDATQDAHQAETPADLPTASGPGSDGLWPADQHREEWNRGLARTMAWCMIPTGDRDDADLAAWRKIWAMVETTAPLDVHRKEAAAILAAIDGVLTDRTQNRAQAQA